MLDALDDWTNGRYHKVIRARKFVYNLHALFRKLLWN